MAKGRHGPAPAFGGPWTKEKLEILGRYLDAYTTALKDQSFRLVYMDAFAGSGKIETPAEDDDRKSFLSGSVEIALEVADNPFDELIFIEKNQSRLSNLEDIRKRHPGRRIELVNNDANEFIRGSRTDWTNRRGILFLDPFATEAEWSTLEAAARLQALDTWILVPVSAISRILPTSRRPEDISGAWPERLGRVFGDDSWRRLYHENPQLDLFGDAKHERDSGVDGLVNLYKEKLRGLFKERFLERSRTLRNSKNAPLFEFMFCAGHPRGACIAKRIARHILERL